MGLGRDHSGQANMSVLIGVVIFVLVSAILYPLVGDQVSDLTNESGDNYVGSDSSALVGMIPIFYWLAVALAVIGVALYTIRDQI